MTVSWDEPRRPSYVETAGPGFYALLVALLMLGALLAGWAL